jgi:hypothetical protein
VDFSTGTLSIGATRNGALSDAVVNVFAAGTRERVTGGRTYTGTTSNPKAIKLVAGTYDVEVASVEVKGKPTVVFEAVEVPPQGTAERQARFDSGTLRIGVVQGGMPLDAVVSVAGADGKPVAQARTYTASTSNPKAFELPAGSYEVTVKPVKLKDKPKKTLSVDVVAGQTAEATVDFAN